MDFPSKETIGVVRNALLSAPCVHTVEIYRFCVEDKAGLLVCSILNGNRENRFDVYEIEASLIQTFPSVLFDFRTRIGQPLTKTTTSVTTTDSLSYVWTVSAEPV